MEKGKGKGKKKNLERDFWKKISHKGVSNSKTIKL